MNRETSAHTALIVNSVWLEIFVISFFDWSIFGKYGFRLVLWKCRVFFVKMGKNKSGMPPEFCLFVIGGKEMLLYLIGHNKARICFRVCKGDSHTTRSAQNAANAELTFKMAITSSESYSSRVEI